MHPSFSALAAAFAVAVAACGTDVTQVQASSGATGSGGSSSTGTTVTTGSGGASTTTGGGGAGPTLCGGKAAIPCGPDEWCQFKPGGPCGEFDNSGTCQPKPPGCLADCPGVCGCDGKFYCNACGASESGFDVSESTSCLAPDSYRAIGLFTNAPRFALLKASPTRNLCFRLTVRASLDEGLGISGDGWAVEQAEVTHDAKDCAVGAGPLPPPLDVSHAASAGEGSLSVTKAPAQCVAGIHPTLLITDNPPWAPPSEPLDAEGLVIEGGCP